jgi:hypothetical protein
VPPPGPALPPQERLQLRGWADIGGAFFRVEAASPLLPDSVSVFEAEQLLIAPGGGWTPECLRLFGLASDLEVGRWQAGGAPALPRGRPCTLPACLLASSPDQSLNPLRTLPPMPPARRRPLPLQVREVASGGWLAGSEASKLPLWQFWGAPAAPDGPAPAQPCYGLPALPGGARVGLGQVAWQGRRVGGQGRFGAFEWAPAPAAGAAHALEAAAGLFLRGVSLQAEPGATDAGDDDFVVEEETAEGLWPRGRGSGGTAGAGARRRRLRSQLLTTVGDGLPVVGDHPGFEPGRALVVCGASGGAAGGDGCLPAFQIAPILAKVAADLLTGRATAPGAPAAGSGTARREDAEEASKRQQWQQQWQPAGGTAGDAAAGGGKSSGTVAGGGEASGEASSSLAAALWAARPAVGLRTQPLAADAEEGGGGALDTLSELGLLQRRQAPSKEAAERAADEASDRKEGRDGRGRATFV